VLNPEDELKMVEAGGGGYGDPMERPVEKIMEDVKQGFLSIESAIRDYGVKVDVKKDSAERL